MKTYPSEDLDCWLDSDFLSGTESEHHLNVLLQEIHWRQDEIAMFGRQVKIPRLQCFMGDTGIEYRYSGLLLKAAPWHPVVAALKQRIEKLTQHRFNAVLLNLYRNGEDSMGWHKDDEPELGPNPVIASLSLGGTRRFLLRNSDNSKHEIILKSGSLLWMGPALQQHWQHSIPKTKRPCDQRINLTFRMIKE